MVDIIVNNVPDITEWNYQKKLKLFRWQIVTKSFFSEFEVVVPLKSARIRFESLKVYQSVQTMQKKTSDL